VAAFVAMDHLYDGACPDVEQPDERDERCPACTRLTALTGPVTSPEQPCQAKDFSGETWCQREVVAGRDYCWSHLPFPPDSPGT
jgi:hypothetical protein